MKKVKAKRNIASSMFLLVALSISVPSLSSWASLPSSDLSDLDSIPNRGKSALSDFNKHEIPPVPLFYDAEINTVCSISTESSVFEEIENMPEMQDDEVIESY